MEKGNSKRIRIIFSIAVTIGLILGICGYGYSTYDWFKNTKQLYLEAEVSAFESQYSQYIKNQDKALEELTKNNDRTVFSKQEVSLSLDQALVRDPLQHIFLEMIKKSTMTIESSVDSKNQLQYTKADILINGASPITMEFLNQKDQSGFGIPTFSKKYAVMNHLPKQISSDNIVDAVKISEEELMPILKGYAEIYMNTLAKEDITISQGIFLEGDTKIEGTQYTVKMNQAKYEQLMNAVLDKLVDDQKTKDYMYNKYSKIAGVYQEAGMDLTVMTQEEFDTRLKEKVSEFKNIQKDNPIRGIQMIVQTNGEGKIIERRFSTLESLEYTARIATWQSEGKNHFVLAYSDIRNNFTQEYKVDFTDQTVLIDFDIRPGQFDKIEGSMKYNVITQNESRTDYDMTITFNLFIDRAFIDIVADVKGYYEYDVPMKMPTVDANNRVDLENGTEKEIQDFYQELEMGFGQYLMKNPSLLKLFTP